MKVSMRVCCESYGCETEQTQWRFKFLIYTNRYKMGGKD